MKRVLEFVSVNKLAIFAIICYAILVFVNPNFYRYYNDELHAFAIAKNFNFFEIIKLMRAEGHTFIWYMILKLIPIAHPHLIKFTVFIFSLLSIFIIWFKSPYNKIEKFLITFSFPMLSLYPIAGRPYALGIFLIFTIAMLHKKRMNNPILYAALILITTNTSCMAAIGAFGFGALFLYDLLSKKCPKAVISIIILILCPISLFVQWHNPIMPGYPTYFSPHLFFFKDYSSAIICHLSYILIPLTLVVSILYFCQYKRAFLFLLLTTVPLFLFLWFVYGGGSVHHYFLYIYFIIAYWLSLEEKPVSLNRKKIFSIFFILFNIIFSSLFRTHMVIEEMRDFKVYEDSIKLLNNSIPYGSRVYANINNTDLLFLFKNKFNMNFLDYNNENLFSFDSFFNIYNLKDKNYFKNKNFNYEHVMKIAKKGDYILIHFKEFEKQPKEFLFLHQDKTNVKPIKTYDGVAFLYKIH